MQPPRDADATEISRVQVSGHQMDVGEALRSHVATSMVEIARKYFGGAEDMAATFNRTGTGGFGCSLRMHIGTNLFFEGRGEAQDAHRAFNEALEHVAKQLRRNKRALREDKPVNPDKAGLV